MTVLQAQPMNNQRLATTNREHPLADTTKKCRFYRHFRQGHHAHNGLVGGSSPPGPIKESVGVTDTNAIKLLKYSTTKSRVRRRCDPSASPLDLHYRTAGRGATRPESCH